MARRRTQDRRGFTLLEVMVALAIFSIALLALVPLFSMATYGVQTGRDLTIATNLARTYIDRIRTTPFGDIGVDNCATLPCQPVAAEVTANAPFTVTWTVTAADGSAYNYATPPSPNMKRVTVTVTCATCARRNLRVQMTTLISERS